MECSLNILSAVVLATAIVTAPATQAAEAPEFRIVRQPGIVYLQELSMEAASSSKNTPLPSDFQ